MTTTFSTTEINFLRKICAEHDISEHDISEEQDNFISDATIDNLVTLYLAFKDTEVTKRQFDQLILKLIYAGKDSREFIFSEFMTGKILKSFDGSLVEYLPSEQ